VARALGPEKLWRYSRLARLWSWALIWSAVILLGLTFAIRASSDDGVDVRFLGVVLGVTGATALIFFPFLRFWLRRAALPSLRLPQATKASGPRRLEASASDWRRWTLVTGLILTVGGAAMLIFLVGVLGPGGTAEGVVVGVLAAWGLATLEDARRIDDAVAADNRLYYAACRRPTGVGNRLVWVAAGTKKGKRAAA
jgi:hypothetical protein